MSKACVECSGPLASNHGNAALCSPRCAFWRKVAVGSEESCWLYAGAIQSNGYGRFAHRIDGVTRCFGAHRFAYEDRVGAIPRGLYVCHTCDVRHCCNPRHLWLGTPADNSADMKAKGRQTKGDMTPPETRARGERNGAAKLDALAVRAIRDARASGISRRALATQYGVGLSTVRRVLSRQTWAHV